MHRLKIFVSAYACEPDLGSEIGVGWHWVLEMSKYVDLWVLTRESNRHAIESWMAEHPEYAQIHFIYFDLPYYLRFWKKGLRGVRTYYHIWQRCTNSIVKQTMQANDIKIFHHLTYGNVLWKVSSYGQKQFFVWGPVGGAETIPAEFTQQYGFKSRVTEWVRSIVVKSLRYNISFKKRCRNANLILCKTEITRYAIPASDRHKAVLLTDVAVDNNNLSATVSRESPQNNRIEYLTVGRLDAWRGFDLIIASFAQAIQTEKNIHLTIIGEGQDKDRLKKIIAYYHLEEKITMLGHVSQEQYYSLMNQADVVMNASLKEGAVTVSFDCMAMGKPLICIDTTGYTRYFSNEYAVVIPLQKRANLINALQEAILRLTDADERVRLGAKAKDAGKQFSWDNRGRKIQEAIMNGYNNRK
jgi:glycosyltransferase involved in cell wall biosynthesis